MTELSNVARVLLSRMESHPEDFDYGARFGYLSDSFNHLIGIANTNMHFGVGRFAVLNDADRAALADAWRARMYGALEKEIMDTMFKSDAEFEEEKKKFAYPLSGQQQGLAQRVTLQNQMLSQSMGTISSLHNNPNQGLLSSAGTAIAGIFK